MTTMRVIERLWWVILLVAMVVYLALAVPNIRLPGVYYDELVQVLPAMSAVGYSVGDDYLYVPKSVISLGPVRFPLLIMPYLGSLETMIFIPVFAILEPSMVSIRMTFVVLGLASVILLFMLAKQVCGIRVAAIATLLLATDACYVFFSRADNGPMDTMMIIKLCMLICFVYWWRTGKARGFYAGSFLAGFGVYDKANFLWLIAAGVLMVCLFAFRKVWERLRGRWGMLLLAGLLFVLGASPFLAYVLLTKGGPFRLLLSSFGNTAFGVNNLDALDNLMIRIKSFYQLVSGYEALNIYTTSFAGVQVPFERLFSLQPWAMTLAVVAPIVLYLWQRRPVSARLAISMALAGMIIVILVLSIFTPTNFSSHHLLMIYPFPHLLIANSAVLMWDALISGVQVPSTQMHKASKRIRYLPRIAIALVIASTVLLNALVTVHNHRVLRMTQGVGMWSAAIYELADYLVSEGRPVVCLDWGLCHNLLVLSKGRLETSDEWQQFLYPQPDTSAMEAWLKDDNTLFVFHAPAYSGVLTITDQDYPRQTFFETAQKMGLEAQLVKTLRQANGDPVYQVYAVREG